MTDVLVRPRGGYVLPGIPRKGAYMPKSLADEWTRNGLVVPITEPTPLPVAPTVPVAAKPRRTRR